MYKQVLCCICKCARTQFQHPPAVREVILYQHVKDHRKLHRHCDFQVCECKDTASDSVEKRKKVAPYFHSYVTY